MDSSSQAEGAPLVAPRLEGAPSAPLMVGEEDSCTKPVHSTRAAMRKVCLLCQIVSVFGLLRICVCLD